MTAKPIPLIHHTTGKAIIAYVLVELEFIRFNLLLRVLYTDPIRPTP